MLKTLALTSILGAGGCFASTTPSETALCREVIASRDALNDGLVAHPETPEAVGRPAVDVLFVLSVCGGAQ